AMIHNSKDGIAIGVKPEPGTNILDMTRRTEAVVNWLNREKMEPQRIYLDWVYDQRPYIQGAIDLVKQNILIGGIFAIVVLLVFLRSVSSTVVVATAIPISVIGTFIIMNAFGRNLNVVSLAGIAFAVGMLVDNAIVVLENIDRHRGMGKSPFQAAYDGAREVWGAVFASTLTTVAVFLPVVFVEEEAGQLFRDIAIAVSCAVILSLFVSVSVIPMFSEKLFSMIGRKKAEKSETALTRLGGRLAAVIMKLVNLAISNAVTRVITVVLLTYLPQGNRNLVLSLLIPPPGLSYDEKRDIGDQFFRATKELIGKDYNGLPGIQNMFYVGADRIDIAGATSMHIDRAGELVPLFMKNINAIPGMFGVSMQAGIFQNRLGRGRTVEVDVIGDDMNQLVAATGTMFGVLKKEIPEAQIRPVPSIELLYPEIRLVPERDRLRSSGMSAADLGIALDVLMDGRKIGDFKEEGKKKIDLIVKASESDIETPEDLYRSSLATPEGKTVPVSSFSSMVRTTGISEIRHLERKRTFTLQVTPPFSIPLEEAMDIINNRVIPAIGSMGMLKQGMSVRMSGVADKLKETRKALQWNFVLAAVICYLLMAALFGNFVYPFIIMFTVPLAAAGGFMGLRLVDILIAPSPLDILTMLGFVILIGIVVNNAILIVHQALNNLRYHAMDYKEAVVESVRSRLRPIYMSATTSIFGMLPLVLFPGPGSELYRGLGSVILGGLALSTVFTVFVIPSLLMFFIRMEKVEALSGGVKD
ncbi:MAG: acriflavin resistance protein, partial [Nitrospira bacterium SG8_35_1]